MTEQGKKFWTWTYMIGALLVILAHVFLAGCVDVGGGSSTSGAEVCSGTECGTHDESNNSVDNSTTTE